MFEDGLEQTSGHTGMTLALAVNYGARAELARAARLLAQEVAAGRLSPDDIDESAIADHLYTADLPDPELVIRTSGEMRLSNYLLWQVAVRGVLPYRYLLARFRSVGPAARHRGVPGPRSSLWRSFRSIASGLLRRFLI